MKKFICLLLACFLLSVLTFPAQAAGSASLSGPNTVRAGDTIQVSFSAGGGIYGGNGSISYNSEQVTLQSAKSSLSSPWDVSFSGNRFLFYNDAMSGTLDSSTRIFTLTFQVSDSLAPGTQVSISVNNVTLSDGNSDTSIGSRTYSFTVAPPLSGNAKLEQLTVANATLTPGFSPDVTSYSAKIPFTTSSLNISAQAAHSGAKVSVSDTYVPAGGSRDITITVTAENGATKVYIIHTSREQDPNYVPSGDSSLKHLTVEGYALSPYFSPDALSYAVYLPYEADGIRILAEANDPKASVSIPVAEDIPVGESVIQVTVTAENKDVRAYSITVFRAEPFPPETVPETTPPPDTTPAPTTSAAPTVAPTTPPVPTEAPAVQDGNASALNQALPMVICGFVCFLLGFGAFWLIGKLRKKS